VQQFSALSREGKRLDEGVYLPVENRMNILKSRVSEQKGDIHLKVLSCIVKPLYINCRGIVKTSSAIHTGLYVPVSLHPLSLGDYLDKV
jgi:hypothetical protein